MPTANTASAPAANGSWGVPLRPSAVSAAMAAPTSAAASMMTPLPPIPPPPFIQRASTAPAKASPSLAAPAPFMSEALPEIPPPHMTAPYVFAQFPKPAPPQIIKQPPPPAPQPKPQPQTPVTPKSMPQTPPAPPPVQQQPPQPQPPVQAKAPPKAPKDDALGDKKLLALNTQLESEDEMTRADGAIGVFKLLEDIKKDENKSAQLLDPEVKNRLDALELKILDDPSAIVRQAGELVIQTNVLPNPPAEALTRLQELAAPDPNGGTDDYNIVEDDSAQAALAAIQNQQTNAAQEAQATQEKALATAQNPATAQQQPGTPGGQAQTPQGTGEAAQPPTALPAPNSAPAPQPPQPMGTPSGNNTTTPVNPAQSVARAATPGNQLNITSPAQHMQTPAISQQQAGQRLNLQERYPQ